MRGRGENEIPVSFLSPTLLGLKGVYKCPCKHGGT